MIWSAILVLIPLLLKTVNEKLLVSLILSTFGNLLVNKLPIRLTFDGALDWFIRVHNIPLDKFEYARPMG